MRDLRTTVLLCFLTTTAAAAQGTAYQVADLVPNTPTESFGATGYLLSFQPVTGGAVFHAPAAELGLSIWRSDGTPAGTMPLTSGGELIGSNGQRAYFRTNESSGAFGVWSTDGTPGGTVSLRSGLGPARDLTPAQSAAVVEGQLLFQDCARHPSLACDLWISDGTIEGTVKLAELARSAYGFVGSQGRVYFVSWKPTPTLWPELWTTDGTASGTFPLRTFEGQLTNPEVRSLRGLAVLFAGQTIWVSDGAATNPLYTLPSDNFTPYLTAVVDGETLYFLTLKPHDGLTVWRTDGTTAGTRSVLTVPAEARPQMPIPWVQRHGSRVYYAMPGQRALEPGSLWSSDAFGLGAQPVSCASCGSIPYRGWIRVVGDTLLLPTEVNDVHTLWAIDAAHVPRALGSYCDGSCRAHSPAVANQLAMFQVEADDSEQLWVTDGTGSGTRSLGSFGSLHGPYVSASLGSALFAAADTRGQAHAVWTTRGTPSSTQALTTAAGEGSEPRKLRPTGNHVVFLACGETSGLWAADPTRADLLRAGYVDCGGSDGFESIVRAGDHTYFVDQTGLWSTRGTTGTTSNVFENDDADGSRVRHLAAFGSDLAFWTDQVAVGGSMNSFWRSDGTVGETRKVFDMPTGVGPVSSSATLGAEIYFLAQGPSNQIWRTDGTAAGTRQLTDDTTGEFSPFQAEFTRVGSYVYFAGRHGIWRSNGTADGTSLAIPGGLGEAGYGYQLRWLHELGGSLLFVRTDQGASTLWRTQGTPATTEQIAVLKPLTGYPRSAVQLGSHLYFAADDGVHGFELWRTDGTVAGTVLVRDIAPGPLSGNPRELVAANGRLYFTANDLFTGSELWVSDGSGPGTRLLQDIAAHAASSAPTELTQVDDLLYFSANDVVTGRELWALPLRSEPAVCAPGAGQLCLVGGRFQVSVTWQDFSGNSGVGTAVPISTDTGYFWFFGASNVELIVKVLDGRAINGHHWVFSGALSSVEYVITVVDTETGESKTYLNPSGTVASVADTAAF